MKHSCPYCHDILPSDKKLNVHLAIQHEAYADGREVRIESIRSLERTMDRVHYILKKFPAARSNDWELFLLYNRYFNGLYVYNADTLTVQFREKKGPSVAAFIHQTSYETISRSRRKLQEQNEDLRASEKVEALREAREESFRDHFSK